VDESYDQVGFSTDLGLKDANLILAAANLVSLPLFSSMKSDEIAAVVQAVRAVCSSVTTRRLVQL